MKHKILGLGILILAGMFFGCKNEERKTIETAEPQFDKEAELIFKNLESDTLSVFDIEIAKTAYEQETGLMYRKSMKKNQGMLFVYSNERPRYGFYMKNTLISLDLIYFNSNKEIVDFHENTQPLDETPLPSTEPAKYVLEVSAGTVQELGLKLGYSMDFNLE